MKNRLAVKILILVILPLAAGLGIMEYINLNRDINDLTSIEREKEAVLIDSIVKSMASNMMEGRPDRGRRLIEELGTLEGITELKVFRNNGTAAFVDLDTLNAVVKKKTAEGASPLLDRLKQSKEGHPQADQFTQENLFSVYPAHKSQLLAGQDVSLTERQKGTEVLTLLHPLRNEARCQGCHGADHAIRGFVKISSSQTKTIQRIAGHKVAMFWTIFVAILTIAIILYLLIRRFIDAPLRTMVSSIQTISDGDLNTQVPVTSDDEIGVLAENFNLMTTKLRISQERLKQWAEELATEVRRQTEDLRNANDQLKKADQMKSEFLANMSHELRTPLNAVIGFSEVLSDRVFGDINDKQAKYIDNIHTSGKHLLRLINDILDLSKVEAGRMELYLEEFPLEKAVYEVQNIIKPLAAKKSIPVEVEISGSPFICADEGKLKQIMYNLLSNAVKFTPDNGKISIAASSSDSEVSITVTDTGIGIKDEDINKIFKEFYQVDSSYARKYEGTGLGLALTKRFTELMGGTISVESTEGVGSRFTITLPIRPSELECPPRQEFLTSRPSLPYATFTPQARLDRSKADAPLVLIVEDDPKASELVCIYLNNAGYKVATAFDGESAIRMAKELQPFAITLDIMLPHKDGWQVLQELKTNGETSQIPILITSMIDDRNLAFTLGAADYFVKPVDRNRLLDRLENIASLAKSSRGPATILVIDDEENALELARAFLVPAGYNVVTASGGSEGIRLAHDEMPTVIMLNLMMPDVSGFEVVKALKDSPKTRNIPLVIFTAKEISPEEQDALSGAIDRIFLKGTLEKDSLLEEIYRLERLDPDRARMLDRLTGLPNYRYMQKRLAEEISRSDRYDRTFAIIMADFDHFKEYNEANGAMLGDAVIKKTAELMRKMLRKADVAIRYMDDQFFIILPETTKVAASVVAEKIREVIEQYPFPYDSTQPGGTLTICLSVVHYYEDAENSDEMVSLAQTLMTTAKRKGGNCVELHSR